MYEHNKIIIFRELLIDDCTYYEHYRIADADERTYGHYIVPYIRLEGDEHHKWLDLD